MIFSSINSTLTATLGAIVDSFDSSPWQVLTSPFMMNAFIAGALIAFAACAVGYFVLLRDLPFATHSVAHIGFPGATLAVLLGASPVVGLIAACVAGGLAIGAFGNRLGDREIATGTILAFASGLGILFTSIGTSQSGMVTNILFGNILAISSEQLWLFMGIAIVVLAFLALTGRKLMFASVDPVVAQSRGLPVAWLSVGFLIAMSLVIAISVTIVGVLLIFALLVTPAATASRFTTRPGAVVVIAGVIALVSIWAGLFVSAFQPWPPSFIITTIACAIWALSFLKKPDARVIDHHKEDAVLHAREHSH